MRARDIMTRDPITIGPEAPVSEAARMLADHAISGLPVVGEDGQVMGIVTRYDLINREGATVADLMTRQVISVDEAMPAEMVAQVLVSHHIKRVVVMRGERLSGIVGQADVMRMLAGRWVCRVCGHLRAGQRPDSCPDCGVEGSRFERVAPPRAEITSRE